MSKRLTIGFDAKRAVLNYSGIGNYSRLALESLRKLLPVDSNDFRLYTPKIKPNVQLQPLLDEEGISLATPDTFKGRMLKSVWRSKWLTEQLVRDGVGLYHGLSNELPLGIDRCGIPSIVTIHDLIFLRHPEFYHKTDVGICDRKFRYAANVATRIIAISERTRLDLMELYGIPSEKIDVVYQGCADIFYQQISQDEIESVRQLYNLPKHYIIGIGTIESRKNQMLALKALPMLPEDVSLVLVGRHTAYTDKIIATARESGLESRLHIIHGAQFAHFPAMYAGAIAASYPSFYEGFGIPILEAIAAGSPVIAATGSCLEEAGGPGAIYVDPKSVDEFAKAANALIESPTLRASTVEAGREYIKRFSARNFAEGLLDTYRKVAKI